jgi:hypothetical protein
MVGRLLNGRYVILVDSVVEIWSSDHALIHARAALIGRTYLSTQILNVVGFEIQVEGLDAIAGIGPIRSVSTPIDPRGRRHLDWDWGAAGQPDSTQSWTDEKVELKLQFYNSLSAPDSFFFQVAFSPIVLADFTEPVDFDQIFSYWIEPLRRIVALSTGRKERTTYLSIKVSDPVNGEVMDFQVYGTALHQDPFASRGNDIRKVHRAFLISPNNLSLLALLRRWQELIEEHHPLLETYGSLMFAPEQHPRSGFLLLIQAIEGLHGFETEDNFEQRVTKHLERRNAVLDEAKATLSKESTKFLQHLKKEPPRTLDEAITAILASVPVDVMPELTATSLVLEAMTDNRDPGNTVGCLRLIRNDLAHGKRGYDTQKLHDVVELLDSVVRAHFLRILGCPEDAQRRTQERRR